MSERSTYKISAARPEDIVCLNAIERSAAQQLAPYASESILNEVTPSDELATAQREGRLWVALVDDVPVGFAIVEVSEPEVAYLKEVDVEPSHGRRGIGTALVKAVCGWAVANGCRWLTLTTFRDAPFNMPFYAKLGFEVIPRDELTGALIRIIADEAGRGLDPRARVAMRRVLEASGDAVCPAGQPS